MQVLRSAGRSTTAAERLRFLCRYLGTPDRDELRRKVADVLALARVKDFEYASRRAGGGCG